MKIEKLCKLLEVEQSALTIQINNLNKVKAVYPEAQFDVHSEIFYLEDENVTFKYLEIDEPDQSANDGFNLYNLVDDIKVYKHKNMFNIFEYKFNSETEEDLYVFSEEFLNPNILENAEHLKVLKKKAIDFINDGSFKIDYSNAPKEIKQLINFI